MVDRCEPFPEQLLGQRVDTSRPIGRKFPSTHMHSHARRVLSVVQAYVTQTWSANRMSHVIGPKYRSSRLKWVARRRWRGGVSPHGVSESGPDSVDAT